MKPSLLCIPICLSLTVLSYAEPISQAIAQYGSTNTVTLAAKPDQGLLSRFVTLQPLSFSYSSTKSDNRTVYDGSSSTLGTLNITNNSTKSLYVYVVANNDILPTVTPCEIHTDGMPETLSHITSSCQSPAVSLNTGEQYSLFLATQPFSSNSSYQGLNGTDIPLNCIAGQPAINSNTNYSYSLNSDNNYSVNFSSVGNCQLTQTS